MNKDIIEKIRSLLRLAKSDNAHEAQLAMQRAMEIAAKHSIDLSTLSPDDDLNKITRDHLDLPARLAHEWKEALNTVVTYFNVNVTVLCGYNSKRAMIVGTKLDIELASYVCTYLVRTCRHCMAAYSKSELSKRRKVTTGKRHSFIRGFFHAIRYALHQQRESVRASSSSYQLVLDNGRRARTEAESEWTAGTQRRELDMPETRENARALSAGFRDGYETKLNPGLRENAPLELEN